MQYPALACCTIVESRFSSRRAIQRDVHAIQLFQDIVEAESLDHGGSVISTRDVDACIVGPSVSEERANLFVEGIETRSRSTDCAFLFLVPPGIEACAPGKAHAIIQYPCSKSDLESHIVQAVVVANKGGVWAKLRAQYHFEDPQRTPLTTSDSSIDSEAIKNPLPRAFNASGATEMDFQISDINSRVGNALVRLSNGLYFFRPDGTPTITTKEAVEDVISELCQAIPKLECCQFALATSLYDLVRDARVIGPKKAVQKFRRALKLLIAATFHPV